MKTFLALALILTSVQGFATNLPACYGREYSAAHLKNHPKQTVQKIQAKFEHEKEYDTDWMSLEVTLKGDENLYTNYRAVFIHNPNSNTWGIECDGGSVEATISASGTLIIQNKGFILKGGCGDGEDTKTVFLEALVKGDDRFELVKLPEAFCQ